MNPASMSSQEVPDSGLWMVEAVIQPFRLDAVTQALEGVAGFAGLTVSDVRGFGATKVQFDRAGESNRSVAAFGHSMADFDKKLRLTIVVPCRLHADGITAAIQRAAHTGNAGDGVGG